MRTYKWRDIVAGMSPDVIARAEAIKEELRREMPLHQLRQAREDTKTTLTETLDCAPIEVSEIERDTDIYILTLRRYIEAMGGNLDIVAKFPDGEVRITQFQTV